ncbi:MAG: hypothetical protein JKY99_01680, partial [Rhizobiales bacterium]|nr:hypothetical protein [Hyphomicrobiales bacterium]
LMNEIADESRGQASSLEQLHAAVKIMDEMTQHNAALVEETNAAMGQTKIQVTHLNSIAGQFRIAGNPEHAGTLHAGTHHVGNLGSAPIVAGDARSLQAQALQSQILRSQGIHNQGMKSQILGAFGGPIAQPASSSQASFAADYPDTIPPHQLPPHQPVDRVARAPISGNPATHDNTALSLINDTDIDDWDEF